MSVRDSIYYALAMGQIGVREAAGFTRTLRMIERLPETA